MGMLCTNNAKRSLQSARFPTFHVTSIFFKDFLHIKITRIVIITLFILKAVTCFLSHVNLQKTFQDMKKVKTFVHMSHSCLSVKWHIPERIFRFSWWLEKNWITLHQCYINFCDYDLKMWTSNLVGCQHIAAMRTKQGITGHTHHNSKHKTSNF